MAIHTQRMLLALLLAVLSCAALCCALPGSKDRALFVVPCAGTLDATAPAGTAHVVYDGPVLAARAVDAAQGETRHVLHRPDLRATFRASTGPAGARCPLPEPRAGALPDVAALLRDLRALAQCPGAAEAGTAAFRVVGCADAGQLAGATVRVAVDGRRGFLREVAVEGGGGVRLGGSTYAQLAFAAGHAPRDAYTLPQEVCAGVAAYAPARTRPPRSAFDAGCRVRAVSPLLKAALVLGVPGCATLVVILLQAMAERKRAAELKKLV